MRDSVELLRSAGWNGTALRGIGGLKSPLWKEIMASVTGLAVQSLNIDEGPAFGAAILAGVGAGIFANVPDASDAVVKVTDTVEPNEEWQKVYEELYQIYRGLYPALRNSFHSLVALNSGG